ncbi:hypothetical protein L7F22_065935 [Adiantum nelumboides]|nr:hypothetical protein [Adiantum nelumboides]
MSALSQGFRPHGEGLTRYNLSFNGKLTSPLLHHTCCKQTLRLRSLKGFPRLSSTLRCSSEQQQQQTQQNDNRENENTEQVGDVGTVALPAPPSARPKEFQSSWDAKDSQGNDYLYRLGKEASNVNINVGARVGMVDDLFTGNFLGKEADIVFAYRQKVTRSFDHLQGDYYIAPAFMEKIGE